MIRVEQLQERNGGLYVVGQYLLVEDTAFALTDLDSTPTFINDYTLRFPTALTPYIVTHIGFFPVTEYTGSVMKLSVERAIPLHGDLSFARGSIAMAMLEGFGVATVFKEKP